MVSIFNNQSFQSCFVSLVDKIPTDSRIKLIALNAIAYTGGVLISAASPGATLILYGTIAYGGATVALTHKFQDSKQVMKVMHASYMVFSFTAGAVVGRLVMSTLITKSLFELAYTTGNALAGLEGTLAATYVLGWLGPLTKEVNEVWHATGKGVIFVQDVYENGIDVIVKNDYLRKNVLLNPTFLPLHYPHLNEAFKEKYQQMIYRALELTSDKEIKQFFETIGTSGQISLNKTYELLNEVGKAKFQIYFKNEIQKPSEKAIQFCNTLEERIVSANTLEEVEDILTEMTIHTNSTLKNKKLLQEFPQIENSVELNEKLIACYNRHLVNTEQNSYRKELQVKKTKFNIEEKVDLTDPAYIVLAEIFHEKDCQEYVKELELADRPGVSYVQIFQEELEIRGLGTIDELAKAGLYPLKGTVEEKKSLLLDVIKKHDPTKPPLAQIQAFTHGPEEQLSQTANKVAKFSKHAFFEISIWTARLITVAYNPITFGVAVVVGAVQKNDKLLKAVNSFIPSKKSFVNSRSFTAHIRKYGIALWTNSSSVYLGYALGQKLRKTKINLIG